MNCIFHNKISGQVKAIKMLLCSGTPLCDTCYKEQLKYLHQNKNKGCTLDDIVDLKNITEQELDQLKELGRKHWGKDFYNLQTQ